VYYVLLEFEYIVELKTGIDLWNSAL